jgi:hypothetical protein
VIAALVGSKPHTRIAWERPGTTIAGRARVRTFAVNRGRAFGDEGRIENDARTMSFTLPYDLHSKLKQVGKDALVSITYTGRQGSAKMFALERVEHADDSGAAAYVAELDRQQAELDARKEAERQVVVERLAPTYGRELADEMTRERHGAILRREGDVEYRLLYGGFGPREKNVDNVVGVITGRPKLGSMHFVTPAELLGGVTA